MTTIRPQPVEKDVLLAAVQGDVLAGGIPKKHEEFLFFKIENPKDFCHRLNLEATLDLFSTGKFVENRRAWIRAGKRAAITGLPELKMGIPNISFSATGLAKIQTVLPPDSLGLTEAWKGRDKAFFAGQEADASDQRRGLKDPMHLWEPEYRGKRIDGMVLMGGSDEETIRLLSDLILMTFESSISTVKIEKGVVRQGTMKDHEHFGFNDGVSQPTVEGFPPDNPKVYDGSVGPRGTKWNTFPQSCFVVQDADGIERPKWTEHGSFQVFRKLEQDVKAWNDAIESDANRRGIHPTLLASKIVGRWPSGCPVMIRTTDDDESQGFMNEFDFVSKPRDNENNAICPVGAHIRKMNPNRGVPADDGESPNTDGCMIRRGITYGTDYEGGRGTGTRGLHFVCYQSSIEDSFRFVQKFWANPNEFPESGAGSDSLIGNQDELAESRMFIADDDMKEKGSDFIFKGFNPFVKARGGEYFFTPTLAALRETLSFPAASA